LLSLKSTDNKHQTILKVPSLKFLAYRLCIGLSGLGAFWLLGLINAKEFAKTGVLMTTCMFGLVGFFTVWRRHLPWLSGLSITVFLLFFFDAAVKGFLRTYFGLRPNHSMVLEAIFNSHANETKEFLLHNWRALGQVTAVFALVSLLAISAERYLSRRQRSIPFSLPGRGVKSSIVAMLVVFVALHFNPTMAKENPLLFWPLRYAAYRAQLAEVAAMHNEVERNMAQRSEWQVKYAGESRRTVVWIIGDSINRANMSLYGYPRLTTPMLDAMRSELVVFNDVVSPAASTMPSLRKMLTPAHLGQPDEWRRKPDVLALAEEAGYKTYWLSNQAINDGWVGLVSAQADERRFINLGAGRHENNYDANLLPHFDRALADQALRKLIVVHLLGAHPAYNMRYPSEFSRFDNIVDEVSTTLDQKGRPFWIRQQRNEYDNAILYNDHVIGGLIRRTAQHESGEQATVIYTSDHGQEVGHYRNHAGHSPIDKSGYEIPMIVWDGSVAELGPHAKTGLENRSYQTDHLEHTVLGLLKINTIYYDANFDILSNQFRSMVRSINGRPYVRGSDYMSHVQRPR
jgi:heptose-I-phosphate ethanolaminephosphotransferase